MKNVNRVLWGIYLALLATLLPHTAWAFGQFEPAGWAWLGWVAAFSFESAIAAFSWKLKEAIEGTPKYRSAWLRWRRRYLNVYAAGLLVAVGVSSAANWAHAVEFGQPFAVFSQYAVAPVIYSLAFGGILPLCSLVFARILAEQDVEGETNPELEQAKAQLAEIRRQLRENEAGRIAAEERLTTAEARVAATGDLFVRLMAESKRERILATVERWPALPAAAVAIIAESSPSYVSEVLSQRVNGGVNGVTG